MTKEYRREYMRGWRARNPERVRELNRQSRERHREKVAERSRAKHLKRTYGLSIEEHATMVAAQGGRCAICREERKLHVDHDHDTGAVRGLLCNRCNTGLRVLEEPERLAASQAYLSAHTTTP